MEANLVAPVTILALSFWVLSKSGDLVRGDRDSRANMVPIYGDLYQIKLKGITNEKSPGHPSGFHVWTSL